LLEQTRSSNKNAVCGALYRYSYFAKIEINTSIRSYVLEKKSIDTNHLSPIKHSTIKNILQTVSLVEFNLIYVANVSSF
jgi:hypothetical protein